MNEITQAEQAFFDAQSDEIHRNWLEAKDGTEGN